MRRTNLSILYILLSAIVISFLQSCVSLDTTSYSDPSFASKPYKKICVYSIDVNLNYRSALEKAFVKEFKDLGIDAVEGSFIFPPTREWKEEEFQKALLANGFDGFLKVELLYENIIVNPSPVFDAVAYTLSEDDEDIEDEIIAGAIAAFADNSLGNINYQFQADMIDIETNKIAWSGFSSTEQDAAFLVEYRSTVFKKFAKGVLEELEDKGHITSK